MMTRSSVAVAAVAGVGVTLAIRALWQRRGEYTKFIDSCGDEELDRVAFTSRLVAAERAMESARPDALFHDPYAAALGGESGKVMSAQFAAVTEASPLYKWREYHVTWMAVRTKYIDDKVAAFAAEWGSRGGFQVVNLGAGLDTRAFRLESLRTPACRAVFEIDFRAVIDAKDRCLKRLQAAAVCARISIALDLADEELQPALQAAGFDARTPTLWILEGLTMYLTPAVNSSVFEQIARFTSSAPQALIVGFLGDGDKIPPDIPFWKDVEGMRAFVSSFGFPHVNAQRFGDPELHYGRYPPARAPDASNCFLYASS
mmetsp:Transcript_58746/g.138096  ORF Transcript_58746/g.138096 Transcript_58746/m.138096 type:complete len:316 (-) Transcript_58746:53-1000(-)